MGGGRRGRGGGGGEAGAAGGHHEALRVFWVREHAGLYFAAAHHFPQRQVQQWLVQNPICTTISRSCCKARRTHCKEIVRCHYKSSATDVKEAREELADRVARYSGG